MHDRGRMEVYLNLCELVLMTLMRRQLRPKANPHATPTTRRNFLRHRHFLQQSRVFRSMVVNLQAKAEIVYQKEKEAKERHQAIMVIGRRTSFGPPSPGRCASCVWHCTRVFIKALRVG